ADLSQVDARRPLGEALQDLLDDLQALLHLADADPYPCIDVAVVAHRHLELERIVGRTVQRLPHVESASRGAANVAPGAERPREGRGEVAGGDGAILERGRIVVDLDQLGEFPPHSLDQHWDLREPLDGNVLHGATRYDAIHREAVSKAGIRRSQHTL